MITDPRFLLCAPKKSEYVTLGDVFGVVSYRDNEIIELMELFCIGPDGKQRSFKVMLERYIIKGLINGSIGLDVLNRFDFGDPAALQFLKSVVAAHIEKIKMRYGNLKGM